MKNFKNMAGYGRFCYPGVTGILLLLFMTPLNADALVNNIEKNDKVMSSELVDKQLLSANGMIKAGTVSTWRLHAEQWEIARSGESILSLPVINQVVNAWLQDRQKKIEIQYPGGEEGEFWVQQLSDWFVSLGIPSKQLVIVPGSGADDMIGFALIK